MPVCAVSFCSLIYPRLSTSDIFAYSNNFKMKWINTSAHAAFMVNNHTHRYRAIRIFIR